MANIKNIKISVLFFIIISVLAVSFPLTIFISSFTINAANAAANETDGETIASAVNDLNDALDNFNSYYLDTSNKKNNANIIDKLYIGGVKCGYDENSLTFFYTMGKTPDREFIFDYRVQTVQTNDGDSDGVFCAVYDTNNNSMGSSFIPELNTEYVLKARTEKSAFDYKIIFTVLPIVQIDGISRIGDEYRDCTVSVTDPDIFINHGTPMEKQIVFFFDSTAKIHVRGGISRWFPKKSYTLKFVGENGENKDIALLGMRKDSDWILDAMYIDRARMRNRVSSFLLCYLRNKL